MINCHCRTSLPCDVKGFLDFAFLPHSGFPTHSQVVDYLEAYCRQYGLLQHIKFGHKVSRVSLQEGGEGGAGNKWLVEVIDVTNGTVSCSEFDKIFISTE